MTIRVMWFRRDLRLADNPALCAAAQGSDEVVGLFVLDPRLWEPAGPARRAYLLRSLDALDRSLGGRLLVRLGRPEQEVPLVTRASGADEVHVAADYGPYGRVRDERVAKALAETGAALVRTGSPYAVAPGRVRKADGSAYRVFSPFYRAWRAHGWRAPAHRPTSVPWLRPADGQVPAEPDLGGLVLPAAGEEAALGRWGAFRATALRSYDTDRNRPDLDGTSRLSVHLKYGEVHPRTLLADLGVGAGAERFRQELAWREFYADVLWREPASAREYLRPEVGRMAYDSGPEADRAFAAWAEGRTGFPLVDAGMRQLRAEGWLHNRVRMVTASFLVKDLHLDWRRGARHFLHWLRDGDLASNNHGWQWVAGSGTDAAPYVRVFNPVRQGRRFDPSGDYVRRYVPELRDVGGDAVHEPWTLPDGLPTGYPERIVDHAEERAESLRRYGALR